MGASSMPREILSDNPVQDSVRSAETTGAQAPQAPIQADRPLDRDALAGALPSWDLLPAAPFVRRVK